MSQSSNLLAIIKELEEDAALVEYEEIQNLVSAICEANRIFVAGAGRSGFVARAFSNRLMHLGFKVYFVGEPTTPAITYGDFLIIGSGSGETSSLIAMASKASKLGAKIGTLTIYPDNSIGKLSDVFIKIPGVAFKVNDSQRAGSVQPLGSSFEQLCWLIYDSIITDLKKIKNQSQEQMNARHANLE